MNFATLKLNARRNGSRDAEHVAAVQRAVAQREIGEREEAVEQEERAERPGGEHRQRRVERGR